MASYLLSSCALLPQLTEPTECPVPAEVVPALEPQSCPEPEVIERIVTRVVTPEPPPQATRAGKLHLPIVGAVEWAKIQPAGLWIESRIDTGADTTSIHAEDIQLVEKDGKLQISDFLVNVTIIRDRHSWINLRHSLISLSFSKNYFKFKIVFAILYAYQQKTLLEQFQWATINLGSA
ncbi:MAG: RimK/LysX family protein [Porticoccaceae bacterium]|nr:RimK/LysX family protein [Porticoccaceae bacterium]